MNYQESEQEAQLYQRLSDGDTGAFAVVHRDLKARLLFFACKLGLGWEDAQEAVSDSFVSLWNARAQLQSYEHLRKFLYVSVRNRVINSLKAQQRYEKLLQQAAPGQETEELSLNADIIKSEMLYQLGQAMDQLPKECRRVFELAYHEERSPKEIAEILNMNPATVRSQKRRALQLIKDWLASHAPFWAAVLVVLSLLEIYFKKILESFAR